MRKIILSVLVAALAVNFIPTSVRPVSAAQALTRPQSVLLDVPFVLQVPLREWSDPRQVDGCEEASIVMAMAWARGGSDVAADEARRDIVNMSEYERVIFGFFEDTSAQDTARVMKEFYQYEDVFVRENISSEDLKWELANNRVVIFPFSTRLTGLPIYRSGPVRHTAIAVGYDDASDEIIIHDPFYSSAKFLRIKSTALNRSMWNYISGKHKGLGERSTALVSVGKMQ